MSGTHTGSTLMSTGSYPLRLNLPGGYSLTLTPISCRIYERVDRQIHSNLGLCDSKGRSSLYITLKEMKGDLNKLYIYIFFPLALQPKVI
jgi:hypothetical protein